MSSPDVLTEVTELVDALTAGSWERVVVGGGIRTGWLPPLLVMLAEESSERSGRSSGSSVPGSRSPAFMPALDALHGLTVDVRALCVAAGAPQRADLSDALRGLLGALPTAHKDVQARVVDTLRVHVAHVRVVLDIDTAHRPIRGACCPYCGRRSLRARGDRAWCAEPSCRDAEGRPYVWDGETALRLLGAAIG